MLGSNPDAVFLAPSARRVLEQNRVSHDFHYDCPVEGKIMMKAHYEKMLPGARLWTGDMEVEMDAIEQIRNVTRLPILAGPVVVMPDVHLGKTKRQFTVTQT
ncbi:MAG: hypothetical protein ABI728_08380, partial [Betaproteobacteria bacterium]